METFLVAAASSLTLLIPCLIALGSAAESAADRVASGDALYTLHSFDLPCKE